MVKARFSIAILIAVLMAVPFVSMAQGKITLNVWEGAGGESGKFLDSLAKEYSAAHPNVEVKMVFVDTQVMTQKLTAAAAGNALPEVGGLMWPQWVGPLKDIILPLDDYIKAYPAEWNESDFLDTLMEGNCRFNGVTYGIPQETNNLALYYNKKIFKAAGVQPPKTWDELVTVAKKLTVPAKKQWGLELPNAKGGWMDFVWGPFLWEAGGFYVNKEGTDLGINSEAGRKSVQFWVDLVNKYKVASLTPPQNGFMTGLIAMTFNGPWNIPNYASNKDLDFGIAPFPAGPAGSATSIGGTNNFIFKTTPEKQKAAWDFLMWMAKPDTIARFAVGYGTIPVRKSAQNEQVWKNFLVKYPGIQVHIDSYKFGKYRPYNILTYEEVSNVVSAHLEAALFNKESVADSMKNAYSESKPLLKSWMNN
jgi:multiple sugar transport system substrate-binding protein